MKKIFLFAILTVIIAASPVHRGTGGLKSAGFDLETLPVGKNVTFPRPATTFVSTRTRVQLTGTDMPQSLSFKPIPAAQSSSSGVIKISIYDQNAERVFYKELKKDNVYIYHLRDLRPIVMITEGGDHHLKLQVESNKPLEIGR
jgi:hypothetical protein